MDDELVQLVEAPSIEQELDPLPGGQLAVAVLALSRLPLPLLLGAGCVPAGRRGEAGIARYSSGQAPPPHARRRRVPGPEAPAPQPARGGDGAAVPTLSTSVAAQDGDRVPEAPHDVSNLAPHAGRAYS